MESQLLIGLTLAGTVGMLANYLTKWAKNEIDGSLWCYLFHENKRRTALSFFTYVGLSITSIAAHIFTTDGGTFVGWSTVLWFGVTQGFAVDAIANKGRREEWTTLEREAKK